MTSWLSIGNGGWIRHQDDTAAVVFVRFEDHEGRLRPVDVFLAAEGPILANDLRAVPLGQIEAWVNAQDTAELVRSLLLIPGPLVRTAVTHFTSGAGGPDHWVTQMLRSQLPQSGVKEAPAMPLRGKAGSGQTIADDPDLRIEEPTGRPYGDDFYRQVVRAYQAAAQVTTQPNVLIAEVNGYPVSTVRGWTRTARTRGLMAPGRVGSVG